MDSIITTANDWGSAALTLIFLTVMVAAILGGHT